MIPRYNVKPFSEVYKWKCEMSALMFLKSGELGLNSEEFARLALTGKIGQLLYTHDSPEVWYGPLYTLELIEQEDHVKFPKGDVVSDLYLRWAGYLYFYWCDAFNMTGKEIYAEAPLNELIDFYEGIHVMSFEDQIKNILECNEIKKTGDDLFTVRKRLFGE